MRELKRNAGGGLLGAGLYMKAHLISTQTNGSVLLGLVAANLASAHRQVSNYQATNN